MSEAVQPLTTICHVTPRVDAMARVTGQAKYTNDLKLPGMLYARVLRSPHPHARIRHIDTSAASRLPEPAGPWNRYACEGPVASEVSSASRA